MLVLVFLKVLQQIILISIFDQHLLQLPVIISVHFKSLSSCFLKGCTPNNSSNLSTIVPSLSTSIKMF